MQIFLLKLEIYNEGRFQKLRLPTNLNIFANREIHFWNKLLNQIESSKSGKNKIELDFFFKL